MIAVDAAGDRLQGALRVASDEMERAGGLPRTQPGTGAVDVIVHQSTRAMTSAPAQGTSLSGPATVPASAGLELG